MPNAVQDGECVTPVKFLYQTDKKKNARSRSGHVKKVTVTSNNRIQAGFTCNSTRRNQLLN